MTTHPERVVLATRNAGKVREFAALLAPLAVEVLPLPAEAPDVEETGLTFVENAILKARAACQATGLPALADDSGLEVDALAGAPGIYSARYAGQGATDDQNLRLLLDRLSGIPDAARTARFHCALAFLRHTDDPVPLLCLGTWEGRILPAPRGSNGFGYDPVFFVTTHDCSSAELPPATKNALSHRGQALACLLRAWGNGPPNG